MRSDYNNIDPSLHTTQVDVTILYTNYSDQSVSFISLYGDAIDTMVKPSPPMVRWSGKSQLVVDHQVKGPAHPVVRE